MGKNAEIARHFNGLEARTKMPLNTTKTPERSGVFVNGMGAQRCAPGFVSEVCYILFRDELDSLGREDLCGFVVVGDAEDDVGVVSAAG